MTSRGEQRAENYIYMYITVRDQRLDMRVSYLLSIIGSCPSFLIRSRLFTPHRARWAQDASLPGIMILYMI